MFNSIISFMFNINCLYSMDHVIPVLNYLSIITALHVGNLDVM